MVWLYALDIPQLNPSLSAYRDAVPESRLYQLSALPQRDRMLGLAAELLFQRAVKRHCPGVPLPVCRDKRETASPICWAVPSSTSISPTPASGRSAPWPTYRWGWICSRSGLSLPS